MSFQEEGNGAERSDEVVVVVKNPRRSHENPFTVHLSQSETLGQLKKRLQASYPGNPTPDTVTVSGAPYRATLGSVFFLRISLEG